jgi:serine/threonine-protein phosphatase 2A activator
MPISRNKPTPPPANIPLLAAPPPEKDSLTFSTPVRKLLSQHDLALFQESPTHALLLNFVTDLANSILNVPNSAPVEISPTVQLLLNILDRVGETVNEFPPEDAGGSRFGNKSFQRFYDAVWERAAAWHKELELPEGAKEEAQRYFCEAWGNRTRIDYGSGHELNFLAWM